jgi:hypothetical protein
VVDDEVDEVELASVQLPFRDKAIECALGGCAVEAHQRPKKQSETMLPLRDLARLRRSSDSRLNKHFFEGGE